MGLTLRVPECNHSARTGMLGLSVSHRLFNPLEKNGTEGQLGHRRQIRAQGYSRGNQ